MGLRILTGGYHVPFFSKETEVSHLSIEYASEIRDDLSTTPTARRLPASASIAVHRHVVRTGTYPQLFLGRNPLLDEKTGLSGTEVQHTTLTPSAVWHICM